MREASPNGRDGEGQDSVKGVEVGDEEAEGAG